MSSVDVDTTGNGYDSTAAAPRGSFDAQRSSIDQQRASFESARQSFETRPSFDQPRTSFELNRSDAPRKLAILGLPWDTSEDTLKSYFSQFGALEHAEVMKDRYTGKSRGFGFVTFLEAPAAQRALMAEHTIDGRRCEAKIALPKGEPTPPRTTRIFVARIPPTVTETQFRSYFEAFGKLQDAYMPKDHNRVQYRGIGFVTFTSPDSVEKVMAVKHWMNGHEIAIDRATPKEEPTALKSMFARLPLGNNQRRSFDNGAGIIGPGLVHTAGNGMSPLSNGAGLDGAFSQLRSLSEDREVTSFVNSGLENAAKGLSLSDANGNGMSSANAALRAQQALGLNLGLSMQHQPNNAAAAAAAAAATTAALQSLAKAQGNMGDASGMGMSMPQLTNAQAMHNLTSDISASILSNAFNKAGISGNGQGVGLPAETVNAMGTAAAHAQAVQQLMAAAAVQSGRRSLDAASAAMKRLENPAIVNARAGPRIFIGKLTKETSEADVKEYFMKFGYVMDVYMPKSKDNKTEHRGFGFVTFETEAAIQRVVSHGTHRLKGSTIAIDIAMPKVEEEGMGMESSLENASNYQQAAASLGMPHQLSLMGRQM